MTRSILGALALTLCLSPGAAAQGHSHGTPSQGGAATDSSQSMMQERMQSMQERMQSMQGRMESMHDMRGMRMQGMAAVPEGTQAGSCIASSAEGGLTAALLGSAVELGLSDEQMGTLQEILARAQRDAVQALTSEQRGLLEAAPPVTCQRAQPSGGGGAHH